jgi:hypothetical protein
MKKMHLDVAKPFPCPAPRFSEFLNVYLVSIFEVILTNLIKFFARIQLLEIWFNELLHLIISHNFCLLSFLF